MTIHKHRALRSHRWHSVARVWTQCVTPEECAKNPARQIAHGGMTITEFCECGATRESEDNNGRTNRGPWKPI